MYIRSERLKYSASYKECSVYLHKRIKQDLRDVPTWLYRTQDVKRQECFKLGNITAFFRLVPKPQIQF